ncbi:capsular exopolysaccharide synthesis family protein [Paenibacillus sp. V4I3]|uniref:CpsD/CapB family tyrosine-protein kinase n=1 Tax=Paenibacillus sp. V4I3 TaxID=3042305 RepID=UPI00278168C6|nr:CpsD/CapB family tyrosine-protein kinase [Paenibacillus sp. V4I3]MDQ0873206.1 capsular exopolysaccharide synthesis family protein [Paenibacillus sp. V4I3]
MSKLSIKTYLFTHLSPMSHIAEKYRTLRNNIAYSTIGQGVKSIVVTSALPKEGKTITAVNLATAYANADKKVLLVEGDLRKPTFHLIFNLSNRVGLSNLLNGDYELSEVIRDTHIPRLSVITSGTSEGNPSDMLASKQMETTLRQLEELYDVIIIDSPSVFGVTDTHTLATLCDGTLLVVNAGSLKQEVALEAKAILEKIQARIIGAVLNNEKSVRKDYDYYYTKGKRRQLAK